MKKSLLFSLGASLLTIGAFYVPYAWPFIFVSLIPFFHAVRLAKSWRETILLAILFGVPFMGMAIIWFFALPSYENYSESETVSSLVVLTGWSLIVIGNTIPIVLFASFFRILRALRLIDIGGLAVLWVFCEYLRLHAFNLITAGPGVFHPPFFSVGFLAYPLSDGDSWLQLASFGGVWLLSLIAVAVNLIAYRMLLMKEKKERIRALALLTLALALYTVTPVIAWRESRELGYDRTISVGYMSLHPEWSPGYKLTPAYEELIASSVRSLQDAGAELIVLPEGGRYFKDEYEWVNELSGEGSIVVDSGSIDAEGDAEGGTVVAALTGHANSTQVVPLRAKEMLTPQGEYTITLYTTLLRMLGNEALATRLEDENYATAGATYLMPPLSVGPVRASILFCIEILAPSFAEALVARHNSNLLIVVLSHGSFTYPPTLMTDTYRFLRMRVVEAGVPAVVSAEFSKGYVFDRYGRVVERIGEKKESEVSEIKIGVPGRSVGF